MERAAQHREQIFQGIPVSSGVVVGKTFLFDRGEETVLQYDITEAQIPGEIARFETALIATRKELLDIQNKIAKGIGTEHAEIFNAHLLFIEDRTFIEEVIKRLEDEKKNIEHIFSEVAKKYAEIFSKVEDEYLQERSSDIRDVSRRVLHNLLGKQREDLSSLQEEVIVIAYDLSPSDTAMMHQEKVIGFTTDIGGKTSHTAIMARSLEIPAVVGLHNASRRVMPGVEAIVDGNRGVLITNPSKETLKKYSEEKSRIIIFEEKLAKIRDLPAETKDGYRITLAANIELPEDVHSAIAHGAEGVGLYRTEFFYMNRTDLPTEDEHFAAYDSVAEKVYPNSVIVRTLDLGGDKFLSHLQIPPEMNPFLGWRAIRFCLERQDIFKVQLRAILRASVRKNLKVMYPMISGVEEVRRANAVLEEVKGELRNKDIPFDQDIEVGVMIEIPSAALTADILAKEVSFFSIGTNDLIQYSLAVDRVNEKIAYLYEPTHLAVLRLIKQIVGAGHREGIWVGVCGEMAGEPPLALILLGLDVDELSTSSVSVPELKKVIRSVTRSEVKKMTAEILAYSDPKDIRRKATKLVEKYVPEITEFLYNNSFVSKRKKDRSP